MTDPEMPPWFALLVIWFVLSGVAGHVYFIGNSISRIVGSQPAPLVVDSRALESVQGGARSRDHAVTPHTADLALSQFRQ